MSVSQQSNGISASGMRNYPEITLGEVANYVNGRAFKPQEWADSGLPIIRIQNLTSEDAPFNYYNGRVDEEDRVSNGDLLISWSASLGAYIWEGGDAVLNQHIFRVEENPKLIRRKYLYYAVKSVIDGMKDKTHGATMRHIVKPEFEATTIPLPPISEQDRIIEVLDNQLADIEFAYSAIKKQIEYVEMLPDAYLRDELNGKNDCPSIGCKSYSLNDLCSISASLVDPTLEEYSVLPHISAENIDSVTGTLSGVRSAREDAVFSGKYLFEPGDVLYSKLRPYLRKATVVNFRGLCSADMYPLKPNTKLIIPDYLRWLLVSDNFTHYANNESRRARMPKLNRNQLMAYKTIAPDLEKQRHSVARLNEAISGCLLLKNSLIEQIGQMGLLQESVILSRISGDAF